MSGELIYTSAPRGLREGSSGFCTVAATRGLNQREMGQLEALSGYEFAFKLSDPRAEQNPVVLSHLLLELQGRKRSVLSRVAAAGADHTGRSNKIAHHLLLESDERCEEGPAEALVRLDADAGGFRRAWADSPGRLEPRSLGARLAGRAPAPTRRWEEATGDQGWAGALARAFREDPSAPATVVFEPGADVAALFRESLAVLEPAERWRVTFSTYYAAPLPPGVSCLWRATLAGSEAEERSRRHGGLVIDLTRDLGSPVEDELTEAAREGEVARVETKRSAVRLREPAPLRAAPRAEAEEPVAYELAPAQARRQPRPSRSSYAPLEGSSRGRLSSPWATAGFVALLGGVVGVLVALSVRSQRQEPPPEPPPATARASRPAPSEAKRPADAPAERPRPAPDLQPLPPVPNEPAEQSATDPVPGPAGGEEPSGDEPSADEGGDRPGHVEGGGEEGPNLGFVLPTRREEPASSVALRFSPEVEQREPVSGLVLHGGEHPAGVAYVATPAHSAAGDRIVWEISAEVPVGEMLEVVSRTGRRTSLRVSEKEAGVLFLEVPSQGHGETTGDLLATVRLAQTDSGRTLEARLEPGFGGSVLARAFVLEAHTNSGAVFLFPFAERLWASRTLDLSALGDRAEVVLGGTAPPPPEDGAFLPTADVPWLRLGIWGGVSSASVEPMVDQGRVHLSGLDMRVRKRSSGNDVTWVLNTEVLKNLTEHLEDWNERAAEVGRAVALRAKVDELRVEVNSLGLEMSEQPLEEFEELKQQRKEAQEKLRQAREVYEAALSDELQDGARLAREVRDSVLPQLHIRLIDPWGLPVDSLRLTWGDGPLNDLVELFPEAEEGED